MKISRISISMLMWFAMMLVSQRLGAQQTNSPSAPPAAPAASPTAQASPTPSAGASAFDDRFTKLVAEVTPEPALRFTYRLWPVVNVAEATVEADGQVIPSRSTPFAESALNTSAMLVLVDTSVGQAQSPRSRTIGQNKKVIEDLANLLTPRTSLGIYGFANSLVEFAPIGSSPSEVRAAVARIRPDGLGTRIALSAREAIPKLAAHPAQRKALVIFTDAKEEDTGYGWQDVRAAAEEAGIMVFAVGCPESPVDVPGLGALQRLAEDTKGFYAQMVLPAGASRGASQNPPGLAQSMLASLDSGGDVVASLKEQPTDARIVVRLKTEAGQTLEKQLDRTAAAAASPTPGASPQSEASPSPAAVAAEAVPAADPAKRFLRTILDEKNRIWLVVAGAGVLFLALLLVRFLTRKRESEVAEIERIDLSDDSTKRTGAEPAKGAALAYLVLQDAGATRMPLSKTATRIGRRSDNDLVFSNDSVSGHHAEVHMGRDGSFTITDLNSANGVYVNGSKVKQSGLRDGDSVELGEVRFRFALER